MKKTIAALFLGVMSMSATASEDDAKANSLAVNEPCEIYEVAYENDNYSWEPDVVDTGILVVSADAHSFE